MLSLLDTDKRTRRSSITHCLQRCLTMSRTPSVYIHESLKEHDETPGTLLEYHGKHSSVEPTETTVETPAVVQDSKGV